MMKRKTLLLYSLTLSVAGAAVLFAAAGGGASFLGFLLFWPMGFFSLFLVQSHEKGKNPYLKASEGVAVGGAVVFLLCLFLLDVLHALYLFLALMQLAMNLQSVEKKYFYYGMMVSLVLVLAGASEANSGLYLLYMIAYVMLVSMTFSEIRWSGVDEQVVDRSIYLQWGKVIASMLLFAVVIYLFIPRFPAGNFGNRSGSDLFYQNSSWDQQARNTDRDDFDSQQLQQEMIKDLKKQSQFNQMPEKPDVQLARTGSQPLGDYQYRGFEDHFDIQNPDDAQDRYQDDQSKSVGVNGIIAYMRADHPLYLRARVFDRFDGIHWQSTSQDWQKLTVEAEGVTFNVTRNLPEQQSRSQLPEMKVIEENYEIWLEANLGNYIAAAAVPEQLYFPAGTVAMDAFGQLRAPSALKKGTRYALRSVHFYQQGRLYSELNYLPFANYLQTPRGFDPRIKALAQEVTQGSLSDRDKALALEQHLRTHYRYDFASIFYSQGRTPLSDFLFESHQGHCEYFASALTMMLRTLGIPARLVTGFSATQQNPLTGLFEIHALDGHAWVEAYVDQQGWMVLEPTAFYSLPDPERPLFSAEQAKQYLERELQMASVLDHNEGGFYEGLVSLWHLVTVVFVVVIGLIRSLVLQHSIWFIGLLLLVSAMTYVWWRYRVYWQLYRLGGQVNQYRTARETADLANDSQYLMSAIVRLMTLFGYQHQPGTTIESFYDYLEAHYSDCDLGSREEMTQVFNQIHYGQVDAATSPDLSGLGHLFEVLYEYQVSKAGWLQRVLTTQTESPSKPSVT